MKTKDESKQGTTIRAHQAAIEQLKEAHVKHIAKTGKLSSLVDFTDAVIRAGTKRLLR